SEVGHEIARREFEQGKGELKRLADEISTMLKGREVSQWRDERDALKDRERLLIQTGDTINRIDTTGKALDSLKTDIETLKAGYAKLSDEIKSCLDKKALLEKDIVTRETQVSLLSRIRDLEEERERLEDGRPCPLCGSPDHPYAKDNVPALNTAEAELNHTKAECKQVSEKLGKLETGQAKTAADILHAEKEMEEKKASLDVDEKQCAEALARLNIKAAAEERAVSVRKELAGVQIKISEISHIVTIAEDKTKKEKSAQSALEKIRVKFENSGKALQEARHSLETAGLEHERLSKECDTLTEKTETLRTVALKDVETFGVRQLPSAGLDAIMKDLIKRKETWQAKEEGKTAHEKKIDELKAEIDKGNALLTNLEKDLAERRNER
ncbi:MAG: hypothetical protein Q7I93_06995, partial [Syntrophales bacterium]|nr:hypothetical protein [Syntrophales bacterium]